MIKSAFNSYLDRTIPKSNSLRLNQKNLFIMPTRFGAGFLLVLLILFVLGTNYQNNPILLLCYFLLGVMFWSLFQCFNNLIRTKFELVSAANTYAGEPTSFRIKITQTNTSGHNQSMPKQLELSANGVDVIPKPVKGQADLLQCQLIMNTRGRHQLPPIKIRSEFPFGLIQAWSYLRTDQAIWVFPTPKIGNWRFESTEGSADSEYQNIMQEATHNTERQFDGIRSFIPGSPMSQVAWKQYAKQQQGDYLLKDFIEQDMKAVTLTLTSVQAPDLETKLSVLSHACLDLHHQSRPFALNLEGFGGIAIEIPFGTGDEHLEACSKALASYAQRTP